MLSFNQGEISRLVVCLPSKTLSLKEVAKSIPICDEEASKIIKTTGFTHIREAINETSSDLCLKAAKNLIDDLTKEEVDQIDAIIFVSQTRDYILPQSSNIIQYKLGLKKDLVCLDLPLGCSGYVYGLLQSLSLIRSGLRSVLLLAGETNSKIVSKNDKTSRMVFGDGGSASLIIKGVDKKSKSSFDFGSDGGGFEEIIIPDGGCRSQFSKESINNKEIDSGIIRNNSNIEMKGMSVMNFAINVVPKSIEKFKNLDLTIDRYYLHQANKFMLDYISKKSKIQKEKVPFNSETIGNTGPASIPIAIAIDHLNGVKLGKSLLCGFGVGLSWASVYLNLESLKKSKIIEYGNQDPDTTY